MTEGYLEIKWGGGRGDEKGERGREGREGGERERERNRHFRILLT